MSFTKTDLSSALRRSKRHFCQGFLGGMPRERVMGEREELRGNDVPVCGSRDGPSLALANVLACLRLPPRFRCNPNPNININTDVNMYINTNINLNINMTIVTFNTTQLIMSAAHSHYGVNRATNIHRNVCDTDMHVMFCCESTEIFC